MGRNVPCRTEPAANQSKRLCSLMGSDGGLLIPWSWFESMRSRFRSCSARSSLGALVGPCRPFPRSLRRRPRRGTSTTTHIYNHRGPSRSDHDRAGVPEMGPLTTSPHNCAGRRDAFAQTAAPGRAAVLHSGASRSILGGPALRHWGGCVRRFWRSTTKGEGCFRLWRMCSCSAARVMPT